MFKRSKRAIALALACCLALSQSVYATSLDEKEKAIRQQQAATKKSLAKEQDKIDELEEKKAKLQKEIDKLDAELVEIMVTIKTLKADIEDKESDIETTKSELDKAQTKQDEQYSAMKSRIRYIYENGGSSMWAEMLTSGENISEMLNKAEYTQELYDYDRDALDEYVAVVEEVQTLGNQLEEEKSELVTMREENEEEEERLNKKLEDKKETSADYAAEIKTAEAKADEYTALIRKQSAQIKKIQQERAAQEAARKAAEEARRRAAQEAAERAAQQQRQQSQTGGTTTGGTSSNTSSNSSSSKSGTGSQSTSTVGYSGTGASVASYACKFVGNPYVWGGTSLTNGADCSGFVRAVYAAFGKSLPHSSGALRSVGVSVPYSQAKAGDIICYSGHVAIYLGNGAIVHASNKKEGIKISYNAAYRTIVAVRRIFT